jgi:ferredoxin
MKIRHRIQLFFFLWVIIAVFALRRNVEAWCPMGGLEALYGYLTGGTMICSLAATNFFILIAVILLTVVLKRAFCGYLCPLGAIAEGMRYAAGKFGFRQFHFSPAIDKKLSLLKYAVLLIILGWTWHAAELIIRGVDPCYAVITLGEEAKWSTYPTLGLFIVSAFLISMPFCRWLCPFAAAINIFSRMGFARIVRNPDTCTGCRICSKACPMGIDVASMDQVKSPNCIACMECITLCPQHQARPLQWKWFGRREIIRPQRAFFVGILTVIAMVYLAARLIPFPTFVYERSSPVPVAPSTLHLQVEGVKCSGSAKLFVYFLDRQDVDLIPGYLKISTSPASGYVDVAISYDPSQTDEKAIRDAIVEPYYDEQEDRWRFSPFKIQGYDLLETPGENAL